LGEATKFDAGAVVEELEWDFTKFGAGSGVIPEPTDKEFQRYQKKVRDIVGNSGLTEVAEVATKLQSGVHVDTSELLAAMGGLPEDVFEKIEDALLDAVAEFTKDSPSRAQLEKLPMRPRQAFYGWLMGSFAPKT